MLTDDFISYIRSLGGVQLSIVGAEEKSTPDGDVDEVIYMDIKLPRNDRQYALEERECDQYIPDYAEELAAILPAKRLHPRKYIRGMLHKMGVPFHLSGTGYVETAFLLIVNDGRYIPGNLMNHIYPHVAKTHGTTPSHVERSMRYILDRTVSRGSGMAINNCLGMSMVNPDKRLTIGEFLTTLVYCYQSDNELIAE